MHIPAWRVALWLQVWLIIVSIRFQYVLPYSTSRHHCYRSTQSSLACTMTSSNLSQFSLLAELREPFVPAVFLPWWQSSCWHAKYNPACCLAAVSQVGRPLLVMIKRMPGHTIVSGHTVLPVRCFAMILYKHRAANKFVIFMTGLSSDCWTRKSKQWLHKIQKATMRMD